MESKYKGKNEDNKKNRNSKKLKNYSRPQLIKYGEIRKFTLGLSVGIGESGMIGSFKP